MLQKYLFDSGLNSFIFAIFVNLVIMRNNNLTVHCAKEMLLKTQFSSIDIVAQFNLPNTAGLDVKITNMSRVTNYKNRSSDEVTRDAQSKNYFTHLTFDFMHNVLFAGATNKILKLNENLRVLSEAITGPVNDSPQCHAGGCPEDIETSLVNNYNKILVVSYSHGGILVSCGSIRQGNFRIL